MAKRLSVIDKTRCVACGACAVACPKEAIAIHKGCYAIVDFDGYNSPMYQAAMNYYNNGICNNSIEQAAMDECLAVVIPIYSGAEADITGGALYFHSFPNPSDWAYHNSYTQVYVSGTEKFWFYK